MRRPARRASCRRVAIRSALSMPPPNDLWQMDIMGHVATASGRCHPLTIIDDHASYALEVRACGNGTTETAGDRLQVVFRRLCLPARILAYNGPQGGNGRCRPAPHPPYRLADRSGCRGRPRVPLTSTYPGSGRAFPSHAKGGTARR